MSNETPVIEIQNLHHRYGEQDAVNGLNLKVLPGRCYGFFGRNGAGKTTTIKCLLNLLRPMSGSVRVFGLDPQNDEVAVKSRLAYVPDAVAFYPWMTVREALKYFASFRKHWNRDIENDLLCRFGLKETQKANTLSKGQKTQLALISADLNCSSSTNQLPVSIPSCAANLLKRSSARINPVTPRVAPFLFPRI